MLRIIKELFNHCTTMKRLLQKHHKLILGNLINKLSATCNIYVNKANQSRLDDSHSRHSINDSGSQKFDQINRSSSLIDGDSRHEPMAKVVGQLLRLYAKSKSLSACFRDFRILEKLAELMEHQQYNI